MTARARWFLFLGVLGLLCGLIRGQSTLALVSLTAIVWVLVEWIRFQLRAWRELPRYQFERVINDQSQVPATLWAERKIRVTVRIRNPVGIRPLLSIRDVVPELFQLPQAAVTSPQIRPLEWKQLLSDPRAFGERWLRETEQWLSKDKLERVPNEWRVEYFCKACEFSYSGRALGAGKLTLPGLRLTLEDDFGFFQVHRFFELPQTFRVLPAFFTAGELSPSIKRVNSIPRQGIHRFKRAGVGSELLDLQEYVPGDPPKSIAWKASARRDKLMTRKYESEVPVRVHLFVDGGLSARMGGYGQRVLDRINYVAASVAKAAAASGDPVSGMLVDELGIQRLPWQSGDRGFLQVLKFLCDFTHRPPPKINYLTPHTLHCAQAILQERFPELLDRRYLQSPFSLWRSRREHYRLVDVLANLYGLSVREQAECYVSLAKFAPYVQRLLFDAGLPWMEPLVTQAEVGFMNSATRMDVMHKAIAKAIAHAHDNEVFVILTDLTNCVPNLPNLLPVIKLAKAKHHRVVFVCPSSITPPDERSVIVPRSGNSSDLLMAAEMSRVRDLVAFMRRELIRLGVATIFSSDKRAVQQITAEMDLARDGRSRQRGSSSFRRT